CPIPLDAAGGRVGGPDGLHLRLDSFSHLSLGASGGMVDALASGATGRKPVEVHLLSRPLALSSRRPLLRSVRRPGGIRSLSPCAPLRRAATPPGPPALSSRRPLLRSVRRPGGIRSLSPCAPLRA